MMLLYTTAAGLQDKRTNNAYVGANTSYFLQEHCVSILCVLNDCEWFKVGFSLNKLWMNKKREKREEINVCLSSDEGKEPGSVRR